MKILEERLLRGPNIYSFEPALLAAIDLEALEPAGFDARTGLADVLLTLMPTLSERRGATGRACRRAAIRMQRRRAHLAP